MPIPAVGPHVQVHNLHPVFEARLAAFLADPRFGGSLKAFSGTRTYEQQKYLYDGWVARLPGFNLAANPDSYLTPMYDVAVGKGSWHQEQVSTTYGLKGYALDLNFSSFMWLHFGFDPGNSVQRKWASDYIEAVAREYRLWRSVPSEEWHYQMDRNDWTWVPQQAPPKEWDEMATKAEVKAAAKEAMQEALAEWKASDGVSVAEHTRYADDRSQLVRLAVTERKFPAIPPVPQALHHKTTILGYLIACLGWQRSMVRALRQLATLLPTKDKAQALEDLKEPQKV